MIPGGSMRKVCENCGEDYREGDRYCRYCGAPLGSPKYIRERFALIYGPAPMKRTHTCQGCGYSWETELMVDRERRCPKCGQEAPVVKTKEWR